jgi:8-oxo-dGTP pyrophosphatase MutT (NUDIX family)
MHDEKYIRRVQTSVTNFIHCGDEYLFIHRSPHKRVDAGRLNGIGGRVEPGENYLDAVIRETKEETGYMADSLSIRLAAVFRLEGGYTEDWVMCFFHTEVPSKHIPHELMETKDGKLIWLHKDKVLDSGYELVDDIYYCFKDITEGKYLQFGNALIGSDERIKKMSISRLKMQQQSPET